MKIISFNANGIRAAGRKGFFDWLAEQNADVVCIQETKAQLHQLEGDSLYFPEGYDCQYKDSTVKKGYSGVALYMKKTPDCVVREMGAEEFDGEGRYLEARFGNLSVASLYAPSGSSGDHRQESKERYMEYFKPFLKELLASGRELILCGDFNIVHKEIDIKNWKSNQKNSGCLPHERAWMDQLFNDVGLIDGFREINQEADQYTWWSNRANAWANNVGWRIDYHLISRGLKGKVISDEIYREQKFSDHAPLILEYDAALDDF